MLFMVTIGKGQNAYNDAIKIARNGAKMLNGKILIPENDTATKILRNYVSAKDSTAHLIGTAFKGNPFISVPIPDGGLKINGASITSAIGGLDVTNIADGLARFLIKRGKEELNIAFFQRMKDFLNDNEEARTLFPATSEFLLRIEVYRYAELLQSLREAFYKDINNLIVNLNLLIDLPKYQKLLKQLPEIRVAIRSAKIVSVLSQQHSAIHPAVLISKLDSLSEWSEINVNLGSSWRVLDVISQSVRLATTSEDSIAWIKFNDFYENIVRDSTTLRIYLGLLYQQMDSIKFRIGTTDTTVQRFMADNKDNLFRIVDLVENFLTLANDVDQTIKNIKEANKKGKELTNDDYYTYIEKAINITEYGFKVANTIKPKVIDDRYIVMARNANSLYKNIYTKNYNAAVMNAYLILDEALSKSKEAVDESLKIKFANDPGTLTTAQVALKQKNSLFENEMEQSKTVEKILRYGNMMASIVKSENPEDAEAAIEAAALPAGSSSIKKNSNWNISLNAYIGGYYNNYTNNTDKIDGNNSKIGVTAPVGIAFSKGLGFNDRTGRSFGSVSLFVSVIDVGAIAGYRLNDDSTALNQKVTINDIFAPGGYLVYGIGLPWWKWSTYVPLSIGYGWQYGSRLYYRNTDGTLTTSSESRWRNNWFLAIDIPLANFYTWNYKKRK